MPGPYMTPSLNRKTPRKKALNILPSKGDDQKYP